MAKRYLFVQYYTDKERKNSQTMTTIKSLILLLGLSLLYSACYEDLLETNTLDSSIAEPEQLYVNQISGVVTDTAGFAIENVEISIVGATTLTDAEGKFELKDVTLGQYGSYLSAERNGYYETGIRLYGAESLSLYTTLTLVPKKGDYVFENSQGAEVQDPSGLKANFPAGTFQKDGTPYDGSVYVNIFWVAPNNINTYDHKVQVYESITADQQYPYHKPALSSIAYISVTDASGRPLDVDPEQPVEVIFPAEHQTSNDALVEEVTLLSLNENIGLWVEEGTAINTGAGYRALLPHFSWWCIATIRSSADLCISFSDLTAESTSRERGDLFLISETDGAIVHAGVIDYEHEVCIPIPQETQLEIRAYNNCFSEIGAWRYAGTAESTDQLSIEIEARPTMINLSGLIDPCTDETGHYVDIYYSTELSQDYWGRTDLRFDIALDACYTSEILYITAVDSFSNITRSVTVDLNELSSLDNIVIDLCSLSTGSGYIEYNGRSYENVIARAQPEETLIIHNEQTGNGLLLGFDGHTTGTFEGRLFGQSGEICEGQVTITKYGDIGDTIEGTYEMPANELGCEGATGSFVALREK